MKADSYIYQLTDKVIVIAYKLLIDEEGVMLLKVAVLFVQSVVAVDSTLYDGQSTTYHVSPC